jgi:hypothetical protein
MVAILWTSFNNREEASAPGEVLATKIAEHRHSYDIDINADGDLSAPKSNRTLTETATPGER